MRAALRAQAPQSGTAPFASPLLVAAAVPEPSAWRPDSAAPMWEGATSRAPAPRGSRSGVLLALGAAAVLVLICAGIVAVVVAINLSQPREVAPKNAPAPPPQRPPAPVPEPPPAPEMPGSYSPPEPVQRVSGGVLAGKAIERPQPVYPQMARAAGIEGAVVVEVTVSESGSVISAHAVSGHPLLRDAAVQAARGWRFTPTVLSGKPVKVIGTITFNFRRP
jgi:TonB family protein